MIRSKSARKLNEWREAAKARLVGSFAGGVEKNLSAVRNAIISPWSNGQTEGQITRLKLIKRPDVRQSKARSAASEIDWRIVGTGFHRDRAFGQFRKEGDHLAARQFPAQDHTSIASRGMNLPLCKVRADDANFLHDLSDVLANITLAHCDAVGRGIHSISSQWKSTHLD